MGQFLWTVFILGVFVWPATGASASNAEDGRRIFIEKRCYTCHTVNAESEQIESEKAAFAKRKGLDPKDMEKDEEEGDEDKKAGGDLSHIGKEREKKWLRDFVQNPKEYFKGTSDCKRKGKKKDRKRFKGTDQELEALLAYLSGLHYSRPEAKGESCLKE